MYNYRIKLSIFLVAILLPYTAVSLESLDDEELAAVSGQDGVNINFTPAGPINFNMYIEDTDGLGDRVDDNGFKIANVKNKVHDFAIADELVKAGLVTVRGVELYTGTTGINLEIDVGSSQGAGVDTGGLQIGIEIPYLVINEGSTFAIGVAGIEVASDNEVRNAAKGWQRVEVALDSTNGDPVTDIITIGDIVIENYKLAFQLGPEADYFIAVDESAEAFTYKAENYAFSDVGNAGGALTVNKIELVNIDLGGAKARIVDSGLRIDFAQDRSNDLDIKLSGVGFGQATTFGDFEINGLDFSGASLTISGK